MHAHIIADLEFENDTVFNFQSTINEVAQIVPSSSDEELNISINTDDDEETEEQIIERRRKQRELLMKVSSGDTRR